MRGTASGVFQLHSPPDTALPAALPLRADFEDKLRLLGVDLPPATVAAGKPLTVVAYWRALQPLDADYSVFLHLDDPVTGATIAAVNQMHPSDIPTSGWATGLYVRDPLKLTVPPGTDPIQYNLRVGVTDPAADDMLALADGSGDLAEVGRVWVEPGVEPEPPAGPQARFGASIPRWTWLPRILSTFNSMSLSIMIDSPARRVNTSIAYPSIE
jgi:hypothetical protein